MSSRDRLPIKKINTKRHLSPLFSLPINRRSLPIKKSINERRLRPPLERRTLSNRKIPNERRLPPLSTSPIDRQARPVRETIVERRLSPLSNLPRHRQARLIRTIIIERRLPPLPSPPFHTQDRSQGPPKEQGKTISQQRPFHALITGGSRGIGLSVAQLLASRSYRCTLISRDAGTLSTALKSLDPLPSHFDPKYAHSVIPGDVSSGAFWSYPKSKGSTTETSSSSSTTTTNESSKDHTDGPRIFGSYLKRPDSNTSDYIGKIDIVVHCAGITQSSLHTRTSPEDMQRLIATNLTSIMLANRFLMRFGYFKGGGQQEQRNGGPVIIHVASLLGVKGGFGASAYAASKAGLIGFTRALASEYKTHGCRVNAVLPGYIGTDMTSDLNEKHLNSMIPLGRFGTPEEVAHAVLFLVQNQYAHNCILNLDGGLSAT